MWDTGGIFGAGDAELTEQVRRAADEALRQGDVLLFVVDAKEGLSPVDEELGRMLRKSRKPVVLVINKIDTEKHELFAAEFDSLGFEQIISVSAEHDRGISELLSAIERLVPSPANFQPRTSNTERPIAIAIVGRPNVGKSSLINSIVRSETCDCKRVARHNTRRHRHSLRARRPELRLYRHGRNSPARKTFEFG